MLITDPPITYTILEHELYYLDLPTIRMVAVSVVLYGRGEVDVPDGISCKDLKYIIHEVCDTLLG